MKSFYSSCKRVSLGGRSRTERHANYAYAVRFRIAPYPLHRLKYICGTALSVRVKRFDRNDIRTGRYPGVPASRHKPVTGKSSGYRRTVTVIVIRAFFSGYEINERFQSVGQHKIDMRLYARVYDRHGRSGSGKRLYRIIRTLHCRLCAI